MSDARIESEIDLSALRIKSEGSSGEKTRGHEGRPSHIMLVDEGDKTKISRNGRLLFDKRFLLQILGLLL